MVNKFNRRKKRAPTYIKGGDSELELNYKGVKDNILQYSTRKQCDLKIQFTHLNSSKKPDLKNQI